MIDVKQAVQIAKQSALGITLSIPRKLEGLASVLRISADPFVYRKFLIDAETGEFAAVKMRELASR